MTKAQLSIATHRAFDRSRPSRVRLSRLLDRAVGAPCFDTTPLHLPAYWIPPLPEGRAERVDAFLQQREGQLAVVQAALSLDARQTRAMAVLKAGARLFLQSIGVEAQRWELCDRIVATTPEERARIMSALLHRQHQDVDPEEIRGVTIQELGLAFVHATAANEFLLCAAHEMAHLLSGVVLWPRCPHGTVEGMHVLQSGLSLRPSFFGFNEGVTELMGREIVRHAIRLDPAIIFHAEPPPMSGTEWDFLAIGDLSYVPQARVIEGIIADIARRRDVSPHAARTALFRAAVSCDWSIYRLLSELYPALLVRRIARMGALPESAWRCLPVLKRYDDVTVTKHMV